MRPTRRVRGSVQALKGCRLPTGGPTSPSAAEPLDSTTAGRNARTETSVPISTRTDEHGQVRPDRHRGVLRGSPDPGREDGSQAEGSVEPRHDRVAEMSLDGGALQVHRHVPRPRAQAQGEQAQTHRHHSGATGADPGHHEPDRHHARTERDSASGTDVAAQPAGRRQGQDGAGRQPQQHQPELAGRQVQRVAGGGDAGRPGRERHAVEREHGRHAVACGHDRVGRERRDAQGSPATRLKSVRPDGPAPEPFRGRRHLRRSRSGRCGRCPPRRPAGPRCRPSRPLPRRDREPRPAW